MPDSIEAELREFIKRMLIQQPFYGDILLRLPIVRDDTIPTACTDGRTIRWSGRFFRGLTPEQRHYVLMHEVFHTLLRHPRRLRDRQPQLWNVAADIVVNSYCDRLATSLRNVPGLGLTRPSSGIFRRISYSETAENLYGRLLAENEGFKKGDRAIRLRADYVSAGKGKPEMVRLPDMDLVGGAADSAVLSPDEEEALEAALTSLIREAASLGRGAGGSTFIPDILLQLKKTKPLDWRRLLREFLNDVQSDDTSYATPERKYLHMDMILPGHGLQEGGDLDSVWAFVDSSGSIGRDALEEFLTQLYAIVKEFQCVMNIAYWDTEVTDVYEKLRSTKKVQEAQPHHSGGTDINCVYRYVQSRRLKPVVCLILTDGYFGVPDPKLCRVLSPKSTLLLLNNDSQNPNYSTVGRVCRLKVK